MNDTRRPLQRPEPVRLPNPYEEYFPKVILKQKEFLRGIAPSLVTGAVLSNILLLLFHPSISNFVILVYGFIVWGLWYKYNKHKEDTENLVASAKNDKEKYEILSDIMARIDKRILAKHGISLDLSKHRPE